METTQFYGSLDGYYRPTSLINLSKKTWTAFTGTLLTGEKELPFIISMLPKISEFEYGEFATYFVGLP